MPTHEPVAGRSYAPVYPGQRQAGRPRLPPRRGGRGVGRTVLHSSQHARAPVYLGVRVDPDERLGLLVYPFRCNPPPVLGRPADEHRVQIRYGGEETWADDRPVGRDRGGVDVTRVLGVHL